MQAHYFIRCAPFLFIVVDDKDLQQSLLFFASLVRKQVLYLVHKQVLYLDCLTSGSTRDYKCTTERRPKEITVRCAADQQQKWPTCTSSISQFLIFARSSNNPRLLRFLLEPTAWWDAMEVANRICLMQFNLCSWRLAFTVYDRCVFFSTCASLVLLRRISLGRVLHHAPYSTASFY